MTDPELEPDDEPDEDEEDEDQLPVTVVKEPGDVRVLKFTDQRVSDAVERQLGKVPMGTTVAFVATAFKEGDKVTTKVAVYVNKGAWSFGGFIEGDVKRPLDKIGAEVRYVR